MGGGQRSEEDEWFRLHPEFMPEGRGSKFEPGGGTFRSVYEPRLEHPVIRTERPENAIMLSDEDIFGGKRKDKKVYDMEALKRLVELLNQDRQQKPYGVPEGTRPSF